MVPPLYVAHPSRVLYIMLGLYLPHVFTFQVHRVLGLRAHACMQLLHSM